MTTAITIIGISINILFGLILAFVLCKIDNLIEKYKKNKYLKECEKIEKGNKMKTDKEIDDELEKEAYKTIVTDIFGDEENMHITLQNLSDEDKKKLRDYLYKEWGI